MANTHAEIHSLFPTPIGSYKGFDQQEELKLYLVDLLQKSQARENSQDQRLLHYFDTNNSGILTLKDPLLEALKRWVLFCGKDFITRVQGYQCENLQVISSWLNWANQGGAQSPHSHENSFISGTYYMCFEKGHAPIRFWKPASHSQANTPYMSLLKTETETIFSSNEVQVAPAEGTLLLWPSHLLHGHSGNARDGRFCLSLNLMPTKLIGSSYSLSIAPLARS